MDFPIDFLESHDEASIVGELQRIAGVLGKRTVTAREIDRLGRVNSRTVMHKFGTLRQAHEAAGLVGSRYSKPTDEELMKVVADLWRMTLRDSGRRPRVSEVREYGFPLSGRTIVAHFGTWKKALVATARAMSMPEGERAAARVVEVKRVTRRAKVSVRKRFLVLKRDRYICRMCGERGGELEVDHVLPVSRGGSDRLDNLQVLCKVCNQGKGGSLE